MMQLDKTVQKISNGNGNIQANGDINTNINHNYYGDNQPVISFYENDILGLIEEFENNIDLFEEDDMDEEREFESVDKTEKNRLNQMSDDYFVEVCDEFLPYFHKIDDFLKDPKNKNITKKYRKISMHLKASIARNRKKFGYFEEAIDDVTQSLIQALKSQNRNIDAAVADVFLNYMYWNCDIGKRTND